MTKKEFYDFREEENTRQVNLFLLVQSALKSWKLIVRSYVLDNTDFLIRIMPEMEFMVKGSEMLRLIREEIDPGVQADCRGSAEQDRQKNRVCAEFSQDAAECDQRPYGNL